ncbi:MAG: Rrf2 family transcriptional regulator [Oscillospiraceae bacterium]|nr:Rrf2 family transcriptional regulator [Oscillospiraceae bacterium]
MLFTKECDYGARIIRALANGEKKTVANICQTEQIPVQYAYKIMKKLELAELVHGLRGQNGGFHLAKSLDMITLYDIAKAVNENLYIFECMDSEKQCPFHSGGRSCRVHLEFERLQKLMEEEMQARSIKDVLFGPIQYQNPQAGN